MPKYVIEREAPGAGKMSLEDIKDSSLKSRNVMKDMDSDIHWVQSYISDDKIYCVYVAPNEQAIRDHGERAGLPVTRISKVVRAIDATTAE